MIVLFDFQSPVFFWLILGFLFAWFWLIDNSEDDDDQGGGMLQPVYRRIDK